MRNVKKKGIFQHAEPLLGVSSIYGMLLLCKAPVCDWCMPLWVCSVHIKPIIGMMADAECVGCTCRGGGGDGFCRSAASTLYQLVNKRLSVSAHIKARGCCAINERCVV